MKPPRLGEIGRLLPPLDELRPVRRLLISNSTTDPERRWSASGELASIEDRLVNPSALAEEAERLAQREARHLEAVYRAVGRALRALENGDPAAAVDAFLDAADEEESRGDHARAGAYAQAAYRAAADLQDRRPAALSLLRCARADWRTGDLESALERYGAAYAMARDGGAPENASTAAIGAGNVLEERGEWARAEEWYRRALALLPEEDPPPAQRWQALLNLHIALRSRGELEGSLALLDEAETAAERAGDETALPFLRNARGQLEMAREEFEEAERQFRAGLNAGTGPRQAIVIGLNLGEALLARGRKLDAVEQARSAERLALAEGATGHLPEIYRLLGRIASADGNPDAFVLFEEALRLIRESDLPAIEEARTLQAYAEAEARHGDPETAHELRSLAEHRYGALGIRHERHRWVEMFGPDGNDTNSDTRTDDHA